VSLLVYKINKQALKEKLDITLPDSRSFYMGTTPFPYDITLEAVEETYRLVREHTDLIAYHFDSGVPWPEAFEGKPYHRDVLSEIDSAVSHLPEGKKVYLAITPQAQDRKSLAGYWGEGRNMERPGEWKDKDFDDPDVITAYLNYARYMIERFHPDYMAYGIEIDGNLDDRDPSFEKFLFFIEQVYTTLKRENPDLPLFLTFQTGSFEVDWETQRRVDRRLLPFSDYVAISTYPYWIPGKPPVGEADPSNLPEDWFSQMAELAPEKPFAVSEGGYIAEDLVIKQYGVDLKGREEWQAEYVNFMFNELNKLGAEFVVWFVIRDYDLLWEKTGRVEFFKIWRDTGLIDGNGNPRLALRIWDAWLKLPKT